MKIENETNQSKVQKRKHKVVQGLLDKSWCLNPLLLISCFIIAFILLLPSSCKTDTVISTSSFSKTIPNKIDFNFHVKPILSDRCFTCHGPDENARKENLRFDTKEGAFAALGKDKDHFAIIPNDIENSTFVQRIFSEDLEEVMSPPEKS